MTACVSRNSVRCSSDMRRSIQCWSSRRPSPRSMAPTAFIASRPSALASAENIDTCRSSRSARYGRSQGCASNSNAWVVSWRAIQVRNGPIGTSSAFAVWRMFSSTNSRRPGVVSADSSARSYWPRTRWPMNPSSSPSWRVVTQRLASVMVALPKPAPSGSICSRRLSSSLPMMCANATVFACTHSPRLTTATRSTTPGSSVPRWAASAGTTRSIAAAYSRSTARSSEAGSVPGAERSRAIAIFSTWCQSTSPAARADRSTWRPATVIAAPRTEPTTNPTCHRRSSGIRPRAPAPAGRPWERGRSGISRRLRARRPRAARRT